MAKPIIAGSACLCGIAVRYDGSSRTDARLERLWREGLALAVCPECMGGLRVPREPAERAADGRVIGCTGEDCTAAYAEGARQTLALCRKYGIRAAVLKEGSPSCGSGEIYDGSFTGRRIPGEGVTAALLREQGVEVYAEHNWEGLRPLLDRTAREP